MRTVNLVSIPNLGGVYVPETLGKAFTSSGKLYLEWDKLPKEVHTKVCNTVKQGFSLSQSGAVADLLRLIKRFRLETIGPIPPIGYLGKRDMQLLVSAAKAQQCKSDLIATGHMVDVDLSEAVTTRSCDGWEGVYSWLVVQSYYVRTADEKAARSNRSYYRQAGHLRPATSKLAALARTWQEEIFPQRKPLYDWLKSRPTIIFSLDSNRC